jgi:hypothetical protein
MLEKWEEEEDVDGRAVEVCMCVALWSITLYPAVSLLAWLDGIFEK